MVLKVELPAAVTITAWIVVFSDFKDEKRADEMAYFGSSRKVWKGKRSYETYSLQHLHYSLAICTAAMRAAYIKGQS